MQNNIFLTCDTENMRNTLLSSANRDDSCWGKACYLLVELISKYVHGSKMSNETVGDFLSKTAFELDGNTLATLAFQSPTPTKESTAAQWVTLYKKLHINDHETAISNKGFEQMSYVLMQISSLWHEHWDEYMVEKTGAPQPSRNPPVRIGNISGHQISDCALKTCFLDLKLKVELGITDGLSFNFEKDSFIKLCQMHDPKKADILQQMHRSYKDSCRFKDALKAAINCIYNETPTYVAEFNYFEKSLNDDCYDFMHSMFYGHHEPKDIIDGAKEYDINIFRMMLSAIKATYLAEHLALEQRTQRYSNQMQARFREQQIVLPSMLTDIVIKGTALKLLVNDVAVLLHTPYQQYLDAFDNAGYALSDDQKALQDTLISLNLEDETLDKDALISLCVKIQTVAKIY